VREATRTGGAPNVSDAYTVNGQPGDLYNCSSQGMLQYSCKRILNSSLRYKHIGSIAFKVSRPQKKKNYTLMYSIIKKKKEEKKEEKGNWILFIHGPYIMLYQLE
jgi:hypothetical protein